MPGDITFRRLPLLPLAGLILVIFAVLGALYLNWSQSASNHAVAHTLDVQVTVARLRGDVRAAESAHRGYLLSADEKFQVRVAELSKLARRRFASLKPYLDRKLAVTAKRADEYPKDAQGQPMAARPGGEGRMLMSHIEQLLDRMGVEEQRLLSKRTARAQRMIELLGVGQAAALIFVLIAAFLTLRDARVRAYAASKYNIACSPMSCSSEVNTLRRCSSGTSGK